MRLTKEAQYSMCKKFALFLTALAACHAAPHSPVSNCTDNVRGLVVALAKVGQYDEARSGLKKLDNYKVLMPTVISQTYDGDSNNTVHCLEMLAEISCDAYGEGLDSLFTEMKKYNHLSNVVVLLAQGYIDVFSKSCGKNEKVSATSLQLTPHVEQILDDWATQILQGNYSAIYDQIRKVWTKVSHMQQVDRLIKKVYVKDSTAFNKTLIFITNAPHLEQMGAGYTAIAEALTSQGKQRSQEMLTLAYWIHTKLTADEKTITSKPHLATSFSNAKDALPVDIRNLFWKTSCTIKNIGRNEYLFASNWRRDADGGNGALYTYTSGRQLSAGEWQLLPAIQDEVVYFQVKNKYLTSENFFMCESKKKSYKPITCKDDSDGHTKWYLKPAYLNKEKKAFLIKNSQYGSSHQDYLQTTSDRDVELNSREVMDAAINDYSYWNIECN